MVHYERVPSARCWRPQCGVIGVSNPNFSGATRDRRNRRWVMNIVGPDMQRSCHASWPDGKGAGGYRLDLFAAIREPAQQIAGGDARATTDLLQRGTRTPPHCRGSLHPAASASVHAPLLPR